MQNALTPVITRIIMRYLSGAIMTWGGIDIASDPDILAVVTLAVGAAIGAATEFFYAIARRDGGAT